MKLISVLLPCYNSELYIGEAIQSILEQTYTNFELIVLDDGSTDNSKSIIQGFEDSRIKLLCENKNKGIVYQLNKGIEQAKGEYIARMDADDVSFPERFQKQVDFLENPLNHKIDVLGTNAIKFGDFDGLIDFKNYTPKQISFLLNFYCPLLHPTVMIRKSVFNGGLRYPEGYKYAEDFALWRIIDNGNNIAIIPDFLLNYRSHINQTNRNNNRLKIQLDSSLKVLKLKASNFVDNIIIGNNTKEFSLYIWFGLSSDIRIDFIQRYYLKFRKKQLKTRLELLNKLIT